MSNTRSRSCRRSASRRKSSKVARLQRYRASWRDVYRRDVHREAEQAQRHADVFRDRSRHSGSIYNVDGEVEYNIPCSAIRGRTGLHGKTFAGKVNLETGKIRIDCVESPEFWLEIELGEVACFKEAPGSSHMQAVQDHFEALENDPSKALSTWQRESDKARQRSRDAERAELENQASEKRQRLEEQQKRGDDALAWKKALVKVGERSNYFSEPHARQRVTQAVGDFVDLYRSDELPIDERKIKSVVDVKDCEIPMFLFELILRYRTSEIPQTLQTLAIAYKGQPPISLQALTMLSKTELAIALNVIPPLVD